MGFYVVIATHRRARLLERTLESLVAARRPAGLERIVIIENGDTDGSEQICDRFGDTLPLTYWHHPEAGKGRALQSALERLGSGFALFLDDDVRVSEDLIERYIDASARHGRGHFFGGPLEVDYEAEPAGWLKPYLPPSATGWAPRNPAAPLDDGQRFIGSNFGAFIDDVLEVGGFMPTIGPGGLHAGTEGNPTGLETEIQNRMLERDFTAIFVDSPVWHFVPADRCSEDWALHRIMRNEFSRILLRETDRPVGGPRLWRVPLIEWGRYIKAGLLAALAPLHRDARRRFRKIADLRYIHGRICGYRRVLLK